MGPTGGINIGGTTDPGLGNLTVAGTTASTSTTTGALTVAGGAGIAGALNVGGLTTLSYINGLAPTLITAGRIQMNGNAGDTSAVFQFLPYGGAMAYLYVSTAQVLISTARQATAATRSSSSRGPRSTSAISIPSSAALRARNSLMKMCHGCTMSIFIL